MQSSWQRTIFNYGQWNRSRETNEVHAVQSQANIGPGLGRKRARSRTQL
jgi:hypothetical protein